MTRRYREVMRAVRISIVENDALGIGTPKRSILSVPPMVPGQLRGLPADRKVSGFMSWFNDQLDREVLEAHRGPDGRPAKSGRQERHVRVAYTRGVDHALARLREEVGSDLDAVLAEQLLRMPLHRDRIRLLAERNFAELKGINDATALQVSRELAEGLGAGLGPPEVAARVLDRIAAIGIVRARTMARTEMIRAHAEASLNTYEQFDIEDVGVLAELSTAGDEDVCTVCQALEAKEYTIEEARGVIPVHPNCRCAWLPKAKRGGRREKDDWRGTEREWDAYFEERARERERHDGLPPMQLVLGADYRDPEFRKAWNESFAVSPRRLLEDLNRGIPVGVHEDFFSSRIKVDLAGPAASRHFHVHHAFFRQDRRGTAELFRRLHFANKSAYHAIFTLPAHLQGTGVGKKLIRNYVDLYKARGINRVGLSANIDVGSYAWARFGFLPANEDAWRKLREEVHGSYGWVRGKVDDPTRVKLDAFFEEVRRSNDPKTLWSVADLQEVDRDGKKVGKSVLMNKTWSGSINLTDREQRSRLDAYLKGGGK